MEKCQECQKEYDFDKDPVGECVTCGKKTLCHECCYSHLCEKGRHLRVIIDPSWTVNLKPTK